MNISRRHHYLPEFYLKGFTNSQGLFAVYSVPKNRIKRNLQPPSSHFFVKDRNSMRLNGAMTDIPERAYSIVDNRMAGIFQKLQACQGVPKLSVHEMTGLYHFLSNLFWRNPAADAQFEKTVDLSNVRNLFSQTFRQASTGLPEPVLDDKDLISLMRPLAGTISIEKSKAQNFRDWGILYNPKGVFICSDRPFIARDTSNIFGSDFIVPLTKHHLLIKTAQPIPRVPPIIAYFIQLALVQQAKDYCASPDRELIQAILDDPSYYTMELLRDAIFGFIASNRPVVQDK